MIIDETLSDYLLSAGISKKDACVLFDISPRTLKRWNDPAPVWAVNIIKMIGEHRVMPENWQGWYFERDWLVDPAGNSYKQGDINALFYERQFTKLLRGDTYDIYNLKDELKKRINAHESEILISVKFGNINKEFQIAI